MVLELIDLVVLFVLYCFSKMVEAAFLEVNANKLRLDAEEGDEKAIRLCAYLEKQEKLLCTIRLVSIVCCFLLILIVLEYLYAPLCGWVGQFWDHALGGRLLSMVVLVLVSSFFLLLFGNCLPEKWGQNNSEQVLLHSQSLMRALMVLCTPFVALALGISAMVGRAWGIREEENEESVTEEEIRIMVDSSKGEGAIEETEKEMINNIFEFNNTMVGEIATHRTDIVAVPITASLEDVIAVVKEEKYSRIPVYDENIDDIVGFFWVKDLLKLYIGEKDGKKVNFSDIILEPYYVPFSKKTDRLFQDMKRNKVQMAIVIDEYGGTAGIVTMEDLLEEIVGNIFDESDEEEEEIRMIDEDHFLVLGTTAVEDVEEVLDVMLEDGEEYDTIGGYLISRLGRVPDDGERPVLTTGQLEWKVETIVDKRIELVKVQKHTPEETEESEEA